jgi:hypothetical protein
MNRSGYVLHYDPETDPSPWSEPNWNRSEKRRDRRVKNRRRGFRVIDNATIKPGDPP